MMITVLSLLLFLTFAILSGFHFYWFFGGSWGLEHVIPSKDSKVSSLSIPKFATLIVAFGLFFFGLIYFLKSGLSDFQLPAWINNHGYWFIPFLFFLRAIGEFKYLGLFKSIKHTKFAKADSKIFVPLCLFIGLTGLAIQFG